MDAFLSFPLDSLKALGPIRFAVSICEFCLGDFFGHIEKLRMTAHGILSLGGEIAEQSSQAPRFVLLVEKLLAR